MELENVLKLINAVSESSLTSFSMEDGDTKLSLGADRIHAGVMNTEYDVKSVDMNKNELNKSDIEDNIDILNDKNCDSDVSVKKVINSPLVGVFYSAAAPDEDDYVSVGDTVKKGQVIGIIEAMKLMNEIECDYDGVVTDILVDNEQMVEYGQPMFVIRPD